MEDRAGGVVVLVRNELGTQVKGKFVVVGIQTHSFLVVVYGIDILTFGFANIAHEIVNFPGFLQRKSMLRRLERTCSIFEVLQTDYCQIVLGVVRIWGCLHRLLKLR
jgi:hypothetical protein